MKDNEIIELYWRRDEGAISATADAYGNYCHSIAYNILCNNEDAYYAEVVKIVYE